MLKELQLAARNAGRLHDPQWQGVEFAYLYAICRVLVEEDANLVLGLHEIKERFGTYALELYQKHS